MIMSHPTQAISSRSIHELVGSRILDPNDRSVGRVEDVVVELDRGAIAYVVMGRPGEGGTAADDCIALPFGTLSWDEEAGNGGAFRLSVHAEVFDV